MKGVLGVVSLLNIDWLVPYEHSTYSVGVIYMVILNLLCMYYVGSERYKLENVLVIGCLPGPREPKHNVNAYLDFMVDDLLELWTGVQFNIPNSLWPVTVCVALICISRDIPACRKVCGFTGFQAKLGG